MSGTLLGALHTQFQLILTTKTRKALSPTLHRGRNLQSLDGLPKVIVIQTRELESPV